MEVDGKMVPVTSNFLYPIAVAVSVITTLITPYLIRGTDGMVGYLERTMPRPMMQALSVYTVWIGTMGRGTSSPTVLLVRSMGWQLLINLLLTVGIFGFGAWVAEWSIDYLPAAIRTEDVHDCLVWSGVVVLTAPIYLASARKIQAMSGLIAEICAPSTMDMGRGAAVRQVISQVFILVAFTVMVFLTILLSTSILGSFTAMLPLLLMVTLSALFFRRILTRIYSRAEIALHDTLVELPRLRMAEPKPMPDLLREAELETIEIPAGSNFVERQLKEIPLRQQTGASIVAIERAGRRVINPGPEEFLRPGDRILLLGQGNN